MKKRSDIKIAVCGNLYAASTPLVSMHWIRWYKIGEALANLGYQVDLVTGELGYRKYERIEWIRSNFRKRSTHNIDWNAYDVVKILFHSGFQSFMMSGGLPHPFVITKLGSAVAATEQEGIYFFGEVHKQLLEMQDNIMKHSRYVVTLTDPNEKCLRTLYPAFTNYLRVQTGVDSEIPIPGSNPYPKNRYKTCIYAGNIYNAQSQPELNKIWQMKLNKIGEGLLKKGIRLYFVGEGDVGALDQHFLTALPPVPNRRFWDYQYYADVGLALSDGPVCDNEASKIYYYLRGGLPVVAEAPLPNAALIEEVGFGETVPFDDVDALCEAVARWVRHGKKEKKRIMEWIVTHHSWDQRVKVYDEIFKKEFEIKV